MLFYVPSVLWEVQLLFLIRLLLAGGIVDVFSVDPSNAEFLKSSMVHASN